MNRTGISPVTTRTVVWVTGERAGLQGACHATSAVFACGVHLPVTGSLTPGYVLCCAVRQLSPRRDGSPQGRPDGRASVRTQQQTGASRTH